MANWISLKIVDCIDKIEKEELVLPVVQRDFVWQSEKIELLFDTLLKGDSFGGIMTIKDLKNKKPIFSYRNFIKNYKKGQNPLSIEVEKLKENISYVIDGQQRLSAFYIGILGSYDDKRLYFDLLSEINHKHFNFKFAQNETSKELKPKIDNFNGTSKKKTFWYSFNNLYRKIEECGADYNAVFDEIKDENSEKDFEDWELELIRKNIENITNQIFNFQNIGICEVRLDRKYNEIANRIRVVELFRRLNQGGTKLDGLELMASKLKGFNPKHEKFLQEIAKYSDIGFGKDEIIKLIFILQDNHKKTIVDITKDDSDFIENNKNRIESALEGTKLFLEQSNLYKFYKDEKPPIIAPILIAKEFHDMPLIKEHLDSVFQKKAEILIPKVGKKKELIALAILNAKELLRKDTNQKDSKTLEALQELCNLEKTPSRIEVFDNSHMAGVATVGAMIVYDDGRFDKKSYRTYHLNAKDEYAQMKETLSRRVESFSKSSPPDLWILDGGATLLKLALEILSSHGVTLDVIAISKEKVDAKAHRAKGKAKDIIYTKHDVFHLKESDKRLQLVQNLRDEAHRSAITFHKKTKLKLDQESRLLNLHGISEAKIKKLLNTFGTFDEIKKQSIESIREVLNTKDAKTVKKFYN